MPNRPRKWPTYALGALEDVLVILEAIRDHTREAQVAVENGHDMKAVVVMGDVRDAARTASTKLVQARAGTYVDECDGVQEDMQL